MTRQSSQRSLSAQVWSLDPSNDDRGKCQLLPCLEVLRGDTRAKVDRVVPCPNLDSISGSFMVRCAQTQGYETTTKAKYPEVYWKVVIKGLQSSRKS